VRLVREDFQRAGTSEASGKLSEEADEVTAAEITIERIANRIVESLNQEALKDVTFIEVLAAQVVVMLSTFSAMESEPNPFPVPTAVLALKEAATVVLEQIGRVLPVLKQIGSALPKARVH
jgi:hypothetical protein